jgi:hypothetical protein
VHFLTDDDALTHEDDAIGGYEPSYVDVKATLSLGLVTCASEKGCGELDDSLTVSGNTNSGGGSGVGRGGGGPRRLYWYTWDASLLNAFASDAVAFVNNGTAYVDDTAASSAFVSFLNGALSASNVTASALLASAQLLAS